MSAFRLLFRGRCSRASMYAATETVGPLHQDHHDRHGSHGDIFNERHLRHWQVQRGSETRTLDGFLIAQGPKHTDGADRHQENG